MSNLTEKTMMTDCMVCGVTDECRHFDLYVFGSEGLWICRSCELGVVEFIRNLRNLVFRVQMRRRKQ